MVFEASSRSSSVFSLFELNKRSVGKRALGRLSVHLDSSLDFLINNFGRWIRASVVGCAVCLPRSLNPPLWRPRGATTVRLVCCLFLEQLLLFFLYPLSSKRKCRDVCVCFRGGKRSPDRLLSGWKWMGWARRSYSSMGREVEAASAPVCFDTFSLA